MTDDLMPSDEQFRLQCGELTAQGLRDAKAGYRMARASSARGSVAPAREAAVGEDARDAARYRTLLHRTFDHEDVDLHVALSAAESAEAFGTLLDAAQGPQS